VEGGSDPDAPARYHPFYITDDPIGGYYHKTAEEKAVNCLACKIFLKIRISILPKCRFVISIFVISGKANG